VLEGQGSASCILEELVAETTAHENRDHAAVPCNLNALGVELRDGNPRMEILSI
jgi:hypothetical protein